MLGPSTVVTRYRRRTHPARTAASISPLPAAAASDVIRCPRAGGRPPGIRPTTAEQAGVPAARRHQRLVCAEFGDAPVVEDGDEIGLPHGAEPMRDQQAGSAGPVEAHLTVDLMFGLRVEAGAGLVEDHQIPAVAEEGPGQRDTLPLTTGQYHPGVGVLLVRLGEEHPGQQGVIWLWVVVIMISRTAPWLVLRPGRFAGLAARCPVSWVRGDGDSSGVGRAGG